MTELAVLVVDDDDVVAQGHAALVGRVPGFGVVACVGTVREALAALARHRIDLVLLDMNLPDGHGLAIVRALRSAGRGVDVLPITAARDAALVRAAVSMGVVGFLLKPFTFADLRERLEAYRHYRDEAHEAGETDQRHVDAMLRALHQPASVAPQPPKGLNADLLDEVIRVLRAAPGPASASEVGEALSTSRVTARRYLQHLADAGLVDRSQRLGGSGRPEVLFRWRAGGGKVS